MQIWFTLNIAKQSLELLCTYENLFVCQCTILESFLATFLRTFTMSGTNVSPGLMICLVWT